jgi:hypothetical protein
MGKEGKADFHDMSVFMLSRSILLMRMRVGHQMSDARMLKEGTKLVILPPSQFAWPTISD